MKHKCLVALLIVMLAGMGSVGTALADAAPPEPPPGSSVGAGDPSTYVQMVSESVLMEIADLDGSSPPDETMHFAFDMMVGHVQASFNMVNQGTAVETLDVRFPLGSPDAFPGISTIKNFTATVDGQVAVTQTIEQKGEWDAMIPWATWQATFAPGQTVVLGVDYDVNPEGYAPWGAFTYILETGAGWYGSIGEGKITFRLPYQVNDLNTIPGNAWDSEEGHLMPAYTISGTDIIWQFTDLEPTRDSNLYFTVLPPAMWARFQQAQASVEANPDSTDAQLELARALHNLLSFKYGLEAMGSSVTWARQSTDAYKHALKLAPDNVEVCIDYLDHILDLWFTGDPSTKSEDLLMVLEQMRSLAPNDPRVVAMLQRYEEYRQSEIAVQYGPETMTAVAGSDAAPETVSTPTLTSAPAVVLTSTPSPVPVMASTSSSSISPKAGMWTAIGGVMIVGAMVIGGVVVIGGAWAHQGKRSARR